MRRRKSALLATLLAIPLATGLPGCGTNISPDTTLGELLDQITVGDVINAFQMFVDRAQQNGGFRGPAAQLTPDQLDQLEALQDQLSNGAITREQFDAAVRDMIGDAAPFMAFGGFEFFGGPFGMAGMRHGGGGLDLTDEQREQARQIFETLHSDISVLRSAAHDDILAQLTDEQRAILEAMQTNRRMGFGMMPGMDKMDDARRHGGPRPFSARLFDVLDLTEAQEAAIEKIRDNLRTAISDRHQQARDDFRALLTDEQRAVLDARESGFDHSDDSTP